MHFSSCTLNINPALCLCRVKLLTAYLTWSYSCAFVIFIPSHQSLNLQVLARYSPPSSFCLFPQKKTQKNNLPFTPHLTPRLHLFYFLLYSYLWWVLSRGLFSVFFFNNTSLSAHFFPESCQASVKKYNKKIKLARVRGLASACKASTNQTIALWTREAVFLTASDGIAAPVSFQSSVSASLREDWLLYSRPGRDWTALLKKKKTAKKPSTVRYLFVDIPHRQKPWRNLFKSFLARLESSQRTAYTQESGRGTSEMDFNSGRKSAHSTGVCC